MMGCTKPDRSEEEQKLKEELQKIAFTTPEKAFAKIDSAERVGLFSPATANLLRTNHYGQIGQTRLAIFYGEQIKNVPELKREGVSYYSALLMLGGWLERNGEYAKVLSLCDDIIADVDNERKQGGGESGISEEVALRVKSRALTLKGSCELSMEHPDKAEHYFLEAIDIMMDGVKHTDDYWVMDAMIIAVGEATEFYLEQGMPQKALPLVAKGDTALARLDRCGELPDLVRQIRHNNIMIAQAMIYAANGQHDKAETLYLKHREAENRKVYDIGADARYLSMTGRYDEAVAKADKAISIDPTQPEFYLVKSQAEYNVGEGGNHEAAMEWLNRCSLMAPQYVPMLLAKAALFARQGNDNEALGYLNAALANESGNAEALLSRALVLKRLGYDKLAVTNLNTMLLLSDDIYDLKGFAYNELGRDNEAFAWLNQITSTPMPGGENYYYAALFMAQRGDNFKAKEYLEKAIELGYGSRHNLLRDDLFPITLKALRAEPGYDLIVDKAQRNFVE